MATVPVSAPYAESSAFQRDLLAIIAREGPCKGLALKDELEMVRVESVNHARLYTNLDDLVGMGLVEKSEFDKRTNHYGLTERGENHLRTYQRWLVNCLEASDV